MKIENCKYDSLDLAKRFLMLAEKFMPYAKDETNVVDMMEPNVVRHTCGTIACHGGYALLALGVSGYYEFSFLDGANGVAKFLGFYNRIILEEFANKCPDLWGNEFGRYMFSKAVSFDVYHHEIKLHHIVKKYLQVAENLINIKD